MKTLITALAAIAQGIGLALLKWFEVRRTQREAANAEGLRGLVESVGRAQDLEARMRAHAGTARIPVESSKGEGKATPAIPPIHRPGERRITPSGAVEQWTGSGWALANDEFFNDEGFR